MNLILLISQMMSIVIGQPVGLRMSNHIMDEIIPGKGNLNLEKPSGYPAQPGLTWRNRQVTQHNQD